MTRDNAGLVNTNTGEPGPNLEPADVIKCRECGGMVRRINKGHLTADRCVYTDPEQARTARDDKAHYKRADHPTTVADYKEKHPDAPTMSPALKARMAEANIDDRTSQRRRDMMRRVWRGESPSEAYDAIQHKYGVERSTLRADWADRESWIGRVFGLKDAEATVLSALAEKDEIRKRYRALATRAEDNNEIGEATRALKAADDNIDATVRHLRDLGRVASAGSSHTVEVKGAVDHNHRPAGAALDEATLRQIDEITGGDDEIIVDAEYEQR